MSTFSETCDGLIADLTTNVPSLGVDPEKTHRYASWFPEELLNDGARHLAVFPAADQFDAANTQGATLGSLNREQVFVILVWEPSGTESTRAVSDEQGVADFLDLYEAVIARLFVTSNQTMAGSWKQWFEGSEVPDRSAHVRFFRAAVRVHRIFNFT